MWPCLRDLELPRLEIEPVPKFDPNCDSDNTGSLTPSLLHKGIPRLLILIYSVAIFHKCNLLVLWVILFTPADFMTTYTNDS